MSKLFITGGSGFIGSNFIRYWLNAHPEDDIVNFDSLTYAASPDSLIDIENNQRYKFIKGNICDRDLVNDSVKNCDIIVHFAAETHVDRSIEGAESFINTNIYGTYVLLEVARLNNIRFHHISTDEVYGELDLNSNDLFVEGRPYAPKNPYSASKAASDHLVRAYYYTYGVPITITNCSNNFGPFQHPEKFIPRMITNLIDGENIQIYGDGMYVRDWLYTLDHCKAIDNVINNGKIGETYLIGGMTKDYNNLNIAKILLKLMNLSEDRIDFIKDRPGHDRRYAVDWSKIKRELNWEPEHTFEKWLSNTIQWYRENETWWRPLKSEAEKFYRKDDLSGL